MRALAAFGAPLAAVSAADFAREGVVYQIRVPPGRIDILTQLTGLTFAEARPGRLRRAFGDVVVDFIGRDAFLRNKRATGRPKDSGISRAWNSHVTERPEAARRPLPAGDHRSAKITTLTAAGRR